MTTSLLWVLFSPSSIPSGTTICLPLIGIASAEYDLQTRNRLLYLLVLQKINLKLDLAVTQRRVDPSSTSESIPILKMLVSPLAPNAVAKDSSLALSSSDDEEQLCPMHKMAKEKIDEIKRKRARLKEKDMKEWAKKHIPVEGSLYHLKGKRRNIRVMRRSVRSIAEHFTELHLKEIAREVAKLCERGRFLEEVELDPYSHNYEKKYNRGVSGYVYYKVEYKGLALRLNMEIINNEEIPYMVNIIKEESPN